MREEEFKQWLLGKGYAHSTIANTLRAVKHLERAGLDVDRASEHEIINFFAEWRADGKTKHAINGYIRKLNRYLEFRGMEFRLKCYKEVKGNRPIIILSDDEVRRILTVRWVRPDVDHRNRCMVHLLFATGIRIGELVNLNWSDFYYNNNLKKWMVKVKRGKWEKSREIPVPPRIMKMLEEYKQVRLRTDPNAVFTTPRGRISYGFARNVMREVGERAGVPFHAHLARHWRAVRWYRSGVSLKTIMSLLGHESLKTTQVYLDMLQQGELLNEVEKETFFGSWQEGGANSSLQVSTLINGKEVKE